ncbi:hypothetical protein Tco_0047697 [Tanacetum coccineum]
MDVDEFACLACFLWHTAKNVTRDPTPVADDFNAQDYATLVAHPSPFRKFLEEFVCLVGLSRHYTLDEETYPSFMDKDGEDMDIFALIHTTDPTKSELDASVDKLFDEGGSGTQVEQGDSAGGGDGQDTVIQPVTTTTNTVAKDVILLQPRCQRKRKTIVSDAGGPSHPPKRLREDHETPSGASVGGKSMSAVQRLLARAVQNAEVRGEPLPTLPFVTSFVSATSKREDEGHNDSVTRLNPRTIGDSQRFVISSDSSHHSSANIVDAEVDSFARPFILVITTATTVTSTADLAVVVNEKVVKPSLFAADSSSAGGADPNISAEVRMRAEYNIKEKRRLRFVVDKKDELLKVREREIENLKAQLLLKEAEAAEAIRLRVEASKFEAVEKSLQVKVEALKEHNTTLEKKKNELDVKVVDLVASLKVRKQEVADLDAVVASVKSQNDNLVNQVHELDTSSAILQEKVTVYENCMDQLERFRDEKMKVVNDKFDKLYTDFIEMAIHLEERFYPYLLTTIASRMWLLTHGIELAIAKCLNSSEYLSSLGEAIGKAIEKGMQDGLAAGITHGKEGRVLADVAAYNPSAEVDYVSALQQLQSVNFSLLAELKLNKDSSVETLMNILRLEETLAKRENIANHKSALRDIFIPLAKHLSSVALEGTSGTAPNTTTALSITFAFASFIPPISTDDYEVVYADGQEGVGADANPFPNVDDAKLNIQCSVSMSGRGRM